MRGEMIKDEPEGISRCTGNDLYLDFWCIPDVYNC
jgi:hypothetical protein